MSNQKPKKLPPAQQSVIDHLNDGFELGSSISGIRGFRAWLQKPGLCRGGESKDVNANTLFSLIRKNLIESIQNRSDDPYWLTRYRLVEDALTKQVNTPFNG